MQRLRYILTALLAVILLGATACHDEQELIVLSGDLPFKVKTVYLVGNATPKNSTWDIDNLDLLEQSETDPFIWTYHGGLYANGTFKLCFKTSTWAQPWLHPVTENGDRYKFITTEPMSGEAMQSPRQGGDDELWQVQEDGVYTLTFNLRDFTWSSVYEGPLMEQPSNELYLIGNVTPLNPTWDIDNVDVLVQSETDADVYTYHGKLRQGGCFKLGTKKGTWAQKWYHPMVNNEPIGEEPVTDSPMQEPRQTGDDELWQCVKTGIFTLTFNIRELTWSSVYEGPAPDDTPTPIESETVYVIGNATSVGWDIEKALPMTRSADDPYIFTWEGEMIRSDYLLFSLNNKDWSQMIRPIEQNQPVGTEPIADLRFNYPNTADNNYVVQTPGRYHFTIDLRANTFSSEYKGNDPVDPAVSDVLYLVGNATPLNSTWDINTVDKLERSASDPNVFTYHGELLGNGTFKLCFQTGTWAQPWIHPMNAKEPIGVDPVVNKPMQAPRQDGDDELWHVTKGGIYTLTFNLSNYTWSSVYEGAVDEPTPDEPIEAEMVYIIGNATSVGWDIEKALPMTRSADDPCIFTWEGDIVNANDYLLFSLNNRDWSQMIRPIEHTQHVGAEPIDNLVFKYPNSDDNNFVMDKTGRYRFVIDLRRRTFSSKYLD